MHLGGLRAFILSAGSKDAFDRFIFARQGASAQQAKNAFQQYSQSTFSEHTAGYASAVFGRYVDYKVALSQQNLEVPGSGAAIQDIADTLDAREDLRRRFLMITNTPFCLPLTRPKMTGHCRACVLPAIPD